jgi:hypothetical protein
MNLTGQKLAVLLTEEGRQVLALASVRVEESSAISVSVEESEELGLWIRVPREDQVHFFLLRWEYILGVDLPSGTGRLVGLRK